MPDSASKDEVESPSVSAPHALARFEFESGRGNEGTKILMVEWDDDEHTTSPAGEWQISWEGMRTVLPVEEREAAAISERLQHRDGGNVTEKGGTHRMYFLLLPNVPVPPLVTLTYRPKGERRDVVWHTNPLPAIFPPELGASARSAGKKGVLHTIWAKQRLRSLQKELDDEARTNVESVGLTMVMSEKEWIEENFGVQARTPSLPLNDDAPRSPGGPTSPRSPGGSRLQEKLKGLKLGTSDEALSPRSQSFEGGAGGRNPLSPDSSDVAVSSFSAIKGTRGPQSSPLASLAAKPSQKPVGSPQPAAQQSRKMAAQAPPASIVNQQQQMSSIGSFGGMTSMMSRNANGTQSISDDHDEDLFAMPISPRSPEMTKGPFSFAGPDTQRYLQGVGEKAA